MGLDPSPFTLRELVAMVEGKGRDEWQRHSILLAMLANANRKPGTAAIHPDRFNPYKQRLEGWGRNKQMLREMFSGMKSRAR